MVLYLTETTFDKKLKKYLVNDEQATFIYINNFEVEDKWQLKELVSLPNISLGNSSSIVNRMEELGIFLAAEQDYVILKDSVDSNYKSYLNKQGFYLPNLLYVEDNDPSLTITENILNCPETIEKLKSFSKDNVYLMPFGTSKLEELLSELTGIPLATPSAEISASVNSKIFSRMINEKSSLEQIPGASCESIQELEESFSLLKHVLSNGDKLVIKEALGVSGKGIVVIDSEKKFHQYVKLLKKSSQKNGSTKLSMVIEKWIDKVCDINYQFIVSKDGYVDFNFAKESMVENGVHQGHIIPSRLDTEQLEQLEKAAVKIGEFLHAHGYFGVVGVDAILSSDGKIYPNLEINARFNMSTYQSLIQEACVSVSDVAIAKKINISTYNQLNFEDILFVASDLLYSKDSKKGLLVTNFATVNATRKDINQHNDGRLYFMIIENNIERLTFIENEFINRLSTITGVSI
jgi:phosphoribosylaminoimidazole carboxylase (NCAIR synthetase)